MEFRTITSKNVEEFDEQINSLVSDGFRLDKRIVTTTEDYLHFVGFLSKRDKFSRQRKKYKREQTVSVEEDEPI